MEVWGRGGQEDRKTGKGGADGRMMLREYVDIILV